MRALLEEYALLEGTYGEAGLSRKDLKMRAWQDLDSGIYLPPENADDRKYYDKVYAKADAEDVKAHKRDKTRLYKDREPSHKFTKGKWVTTPNKPFQRRGAAVDHSKLKPKFKRLKKMFDAGMRTT